MRVWPVEHLLTLGSAHVLQAAFSAFNWVPGIDRAECAALASMQTILQGRMAPRWIPCRRQRRLSRDARRHAESQRGRSALVRRGRNSRRYTLWRGGRERRVKFAYLPLPVRQTSPSMGRAQVRHRPIVPIHIVGPLALPPLDACIDCAADDTVFPPHLATAVASYSRGRSK